MDGKTKYKNRATTSEAKRYFGDKLSRSASESTYRKSKLKSGKGRRTGDDLVRESLIRNEEAEETENNVARETLETSERTGEGVSGSASRMFQKRRIKKQMVSAAEKKRAEEAAQGASKILGSLEDALEKIGKDAAKFVADNPLPVVAAAALMILLLAVVSGLTSCTMMMGAVQGTAITTSFTAEDPDILGADADYSALEADLLEDLEKTEEDYPGYDEYVFSCDTIKHDGYQLAALLTVLYEDYTRGEVQGTLSEVFDAQYDLELTEVEEVRTRTEPKTRLEERTRIEEKEGIRVWWDPEENRYVLEPYIYREEVVYWEEVVYEEDEEYLHRILQVELTNRTIDQVVRELSLSGEKLQRYELLVSMKGNKSYLF